jgi:hypothetical protein
MHAAFGLRYLHANLGALAERTTIMEATLDRRPIDVAESILAHGPRIVGLGVYIWNAAPMLELVSLLKTIDPEITIVLGGPEVSYETEAQPVCALADFVIKGEADEAFATLCDRILSGRRPLNRVIEGGTPALDGLALPYPLYDDEDVARRVIYVEASRGCPYRCEFCLSSLDKTVRPFPIERFLGAMDTLFERGVRRFKFVDRTFNLDVQRSRRILEFFLERVRGHPGEVFVHFELVPDRLPEGLRSVIAEFPPGSLQFEIGIQSFDPEVGARISRRQDIARSVANLEYLRTQTHVHLHTDLIVGLPGENLESVARGFDRLVALGVHEIQVGVLKRLRGAPIARHAEAFDLRFSPTAPYEVLSTADVEFPAMSRVKRFALAWDTVANSGNFRSTTPRIWGDASPFSGFLAFTDFVYARAGRVHGIALRRWASLIATWLIEQRALSLDEASVLIRDDHRAAGRKDPGPIRPWTEPDAALPARSTMTGAPARQSRHLTSDAPSE